MPKRRPLPQFSRPVLTCKQQSDSTANQIAAGGSDTALANGANVPLQTDSVSTVAVAQAAPEEGKVPAETKPLVLATKKKSQIQKIKEGWAAFNSAEEAGHRKIVIYMLIAFIAFTTLTTVQSVPNYALGIEISPSYEGRTRVVVYRSVMNQIAGLAGPWILPFCFLGIFTTALDGLFWYSIIIVFIGIPSTVWMVWGVKERTRANASRDRTQGNLFKSLWITIRNVHFLKILVLYVFFGFAIGMFNLIGLFLNVYWVFGGDKFAGAAMGAKVQTLAWGLTFAVLPAVGWFCNKFQKHNALRTAIVLMGFGTVIKWWAYNPAHPEYQYVLPFFFAIGITSFYTVLSTMMADVTDVDELQTGSRREGMFGAAMAFMMKAAGALTPIMAGAILVVSGFRQEYGMHQTAETILKMRILDSFVPGVLCLLGLAFLWKYPLTKEKMLEVKAQIQARKDAEQAATV